MPGPNSTFEHARGFTLIEVLIAGALAAILMSALAFATGTFLDSYTAGLDEQQISLDYHLTLERILKAISSASEADVDSTIPTRFSVTTPEGDTEEFSWSGIPADPLFFSRNGEKTILASAGIKDFSIRANYVPEVCETMTVILEDLLDFESYADRPMEWEDITLSQDCRHGFTFRILKESEVERISLTGISFRVAQAAGQTANLKISLLEGQSEERPRPWGDAIATIEVPPSDLPPVETAGGTSQIPWTDISLPEGFVVQPNRFYCILFEPAGSGDGGIVRVAHVTGGTGPINDMAYLGSSDGGITWSPVLKTQEYRQRDMPVRLEGNVTYLSRSVRMEVDSLDVSLSMTSGGNSISGVGRAKVRGRGR